MVKATIETADYGRIEVKRLGNDPNTWKGVAYFFKDDFESDIDNGGRFTNQWGVPFQVFWPGWKGSNVVIEVTVPRAVGFAPIDPPIDPPIGKTIDLVA